MSRELQDRIDDLGDSPGNISATVAHMLGMALDALIEAQERGEGVPVARAGDEIDAAISVLQSYRARLARLDQEMQAAELTAAGWVRRTERPFWTRPVA